MSTSQTDFNALGLSIPSFFGSSPASDTSGVSPFSQPWSFPNAPSASDATSNPFGLNSECIPDLSGLFSATGNIFTSKEASETSPSSISLVSGVGGTDYEGRPLPTTSSPDGPPLTSKGRKHKRLDPEDEPTKRRREQNAANQREFRARDRMRRLMQSNKIEDMENLLDAQSRQIQALQVMVDVLNQKIQLCVFMTQGQRK